MFIFRENYGCHQLTTIALTPDGEDRRRYSLSEPRQSIIGSAKNQRRRSEDYHRAHNPRIVTPSIPLPRHSNCRMPTLACAQVNKRTSQYEISRASVSYDYQHHLQI